MSAILYYIGDEVKVPQEGHNLSHGCPTAFTLLLGREPDFLSVYTLLHERDLKDLQSHSISPGPECFCSCHAESNLEVLLFLVIERHHGFLIFLTDHRLSGWHTHTLLQVKHKLKDLLKGFHANNLSNFNEDQSHEMPGAV